MIAVIEGYLFRHLHGKNSFNAIIRGERILINLPTLKLKINTDIICPRLMCFI